MRHQSRRDFLVTSLRTSGGLLAGGALGSFLAACGIGQPTSPSPTGTRAGSSPTLAPVISRPKIAVTAPPQPGQLQKYGPVLYGREFGLETVVDDFVNFDDNVASISSLLSGQSQAIHGAFLSQVSAHAQGQPIRIFGPTQKSDDYAVVARSPVDSLEDAVESGVSLAVDGPGQGASTRFQAILDANGIETNVHDLTGVQLIGGNSGRATAFANGDVDVTVVDGTVGAQLLDQVPEATIIATLQESTPTFIASTFAATADWLDENQATAEAICASVILASREMMKDFEAFSSAADEIMSEPPEEALLRRVWDIVRQYELWPINGDLEREGYDVMAEIAVGQGIFEEAPPYEEVIDRRPVDAAMARLGQVDKSSLVG